MVGGDAALLVITVFTTHEEPKNSGAWLGLQTARSGWVKTRSDGIYLHLRAAR